MPAVITLARTIGIMLGPAQLTEPIGWLLRRASVNRKNGHVKGLVLAQIGDGALTVPVMGAWGAGRWTFWRGPFTLAKDGYARQANSYGQRRTADERKTPRRGEGQRYCCCGAWPPCRAHGRHAQTPHSGGDRLPRPAGL